MARRRVYNESRLRKKLRRFPEVLRSDLRMVMTMNGVLLAQEIEKRAPKESGIMAGKVRSVVSRDGLSVRIGYSREPRFKQAWKKGGFVALFQEYGTRYHAAQPFIGPAFRAKLMDALRRIDSAVNRTLKRASSGAF